MPNLLPILSFATVLLAIAAGFWTLSHDVVSQLENTPRYEQVYIEIRDGNAAVNRLAHGLTYATVSNGKSPDHLLRDAGAMAGLHAHIQRSFPLAHSKLDLEKVNEWSLLYTWRGSNTSLKPVLCISHLDVVPVTAEAAWTQPPFGGIIKDGYIWGRGAQDVKVTAFALLEAVTHLLEQGLAPQRTLHLAFGHDEEVGGVLGAAAIARKLAEAGVQLEMVLDEGGPLLVDGLRPFVSDVAIALVGTAEKGYVSVDLQMEGKGGHSSLPPQDGSQAVSRLAKLLAAIDARPPPAKLGSPTLELLQGLGAASQNRLLRWVLSRSAHWPLRPLLAWVIARQPGELSSAVRSTIAVTGISSFPAAGNVIPSLASAQFNFRYLPGETEDFALDYLRGFLRGDAKFGNATLTVQERFEVASPVTPPDGPAFRLLRQAIMETLANEDRAVAAIPFLLTGGTDSKHYQGLCAGQTLRFAPVAMNRSAGDLKRVHGIDERVAESAYLDAIRFYVRFLQLALAG